MRTRKQSVLLVLVFLGFFGTAVALQHRFVSKPEQWRPYRMSLYVPSSDYVGLITLGYDHFTADYLWLQSIQAVGAGAARDPFALSQLEAYFNLISDLDPNFLALYPFSVMVLGEEGGNDRAAFAMVDKGIENNPDKYEIPYAGAFHAMTQLKDYDLALAYIERALECPDHPIWLRNWPADLLGRKGQFKLAFESHLRQYIGNYNDSQIVMMNINYRRLRSSLDEWITDAIREEAIAFHDDHERYPSVGELEEAGAFMDKAWPDWQEVGGFLAEFTDRGQPIPAGEDTIQQLLGRRKTGWEKLPPNPASDNPHFRGYMVWPGREAEMTWTDPTGAEVTEPDTLFVMSELLVARQLTYSFEAAAGQIAEYRLTHNGECPPSVEAFNDRFNTKLLEPWGGEFRLDTKTCTIYSTTLRAKDSDVFTMYNVAPAG